MKSTILAVAILFSLAGPSSVLAETPAVTVKPLAVEAVPIDVESTVQQAVAEIPPEAEAPVTELTEQQAITKTPSEAAATIGAPVELQAVSETPAEADAPAPVSKMVEEQAAPETPSEETAADASMSGTDTPRKPCPMQGMGMMRKGMGQGGGGRKQGCDHLGKGQQNKHEQVVRRLDMIEARMAKIEAMLESLMQR